MKQTTEIDWTEGITEIVIPPEAYAFARRHAIARWLAEVLWALPLDILRDLVAEREYRKFADTPAN
jgi:hypothetical protein